MNATYHHITTLLEEAVSALAPREDGYYLDGIFGRGGHSRALLERLGIGERLLGFDRGPQAIQTGKALAAEDDHFIIVQRSFVELGGEVRARDLEDRVDDVLLDLGVSSPQLDNPERGFSFLNGGPLDMRMNPGQGISAAKFIINAAEEEIIRVLKEYGEERFAKRMARAVVQHHQEQPFERTADLTEMITVANLVWEKDESPMTRVFQGLRIHVSNELDDLERGLDVAPESLTVDGRLVVINFHSLEDRIAKLFMRKRTEDEAGNLSRDLPIRSKVFEPCLKLLGRPQYAPEEELKISPRSRSMVIRVAEKLG